MLHLEINLLENYHNDMLFRPASNLFYTITTQLIRVITNAEKG